MTEQTTTETETQTAALAAYDAARAIPCADPARQSALRAAEEACRAAGLRREEEVVYSVVRTPMVVCDDRGDTWREVRHTGWLAPAGSLGPGAGPLVPWGWGNADLMPVWGGAEECRAARDSLARALAPAPGMPLGVEVFLDRDERARRIDAGPYCSRCGAAGGALLHDPAQEDVLCRECGQDDDDVDAATDDVATTPDGGIEESCRSCGGPADPGAGCGVDPPDGGGCWTPEEG